MKIIYSHRFGKDYRALPLKVKRVLNKQENLFKKNWNDPRLHVKKILGTDFFSFRVTRSYRVLFEFADPMSVFFLTIGHRKDIYK